MVWLRLVATRGATIVGAEGEILRIGVPRSLENAFARSKMIFSDGKKFHNFFSDNSTLQSCICVEVTRNRNTTSFTAFLNCKISLRYCIDKKYWELEEQNQK